MKAIMVRPGGRPEIIEIENELHALQKAVGGHLESVTLGEDWCVLCDEEWRFKGEPYTCSINGVVFGGVVLIVGIAGEDFADIPQHMAERLVASC